MRRFFALGVAFLTLAVLVAGCGKRSFVEEEKLVKMTQDYVENVAAKKFDQVIPVLTGDALDGMRVSMPVLEAIKVTNKISDFAAKCDFMNRTNDRASVEATYLQQQTVENFGTATVEMDVVFDFKKLNGEWKIYSIKTVQKNERKQ